MLEHLHIIFKLDILINSLAGQMGGWLYLLIFLVIFAETGLVFMPFLPGDSLLFAVGALSASSDFFKIEMYIPLLILGSILGDNTNYYVGKHFGRSLFERPHFLSKLFNKSYLARTEIFYQDKGRKAVVLARFIPIIRTLAPFVAGLTNMPYKSFLGLSILGSILWVPIFCLAGYYFGQIPVIRENFTLLVMGVIGLSLMPIFISLIKALLMKKDSNKLS